MNLSRHTRIFSIFLLFATLAASTDANAKLGTRYVNCDNGGSVAKALRFAPPGTRIFVRGTCHERIVIKRDRIRLKGLGNAGFEPPAETNPPFEFNPLIGVKDARGVVVKDLFVRNSPAEGLLISGPSSVRLENVSATNNSNVGLLIDNARVEVTDGSYDGNQAGIDATNNASVLLRGTISLQNNLVFGIAASNAASLEVRGANLNASGNQALGVLLESGQLSIFNFAVSQGSQIIAHDNGACGFAIVGGGFMDLVGPPSAYFTGVNLLSAQNNGCGMLITTGSKLESPFGTATIQLEANGAGMQVTGNSDVAVNGGLNIVNHLGPGLVADGAGVITLAPVDGSPPPALPSLLTGNGGPDLLMNFGSRATLATGCSLRRS